MPPRKRKDKPESWEATTEKIYQKRDEDMPEEPK